ncbi:MAG TPA: matrixin family metalloprotease [Polyangiaceae bacterium]|nr:matrixin family metalloprotease [Polyangiaceae bacterium]
MKASRVSSRVLALAVVLTAQWVSSTAHAYCRSRTCSLDKTKDEAEVECKHDAATRCISEGKELHWPSSCLRYAVQLDGSPLSGLDADQVAELVAQSFALWKTAECPGGGNPRFDASFQGFVTCHEHETVCDTASGNVNVIMFHDDAWPYGSNELGITKPSAGTKTGLMNDADVEINARPIVTGMLELFPVLSHELGHYLGLTHSTAPNALMSESYSSFAMSGGLLTADDVAGICAIYPPSGVPLSCKTTAPARDTCALPGPDPEPPEKCSLGTVSYPANDGCSVARVGVQRPATPLFAFGTALGLAWLVRRRRRGAGR